MFNRFAVTMALVLCLAGLIHAQSADTRPPGSTEKLPPIEPIPAISPSASTPDNCCAAASCSSDADWWGSAEYILAWVRGVNLPPLVTTSPAGTSQTNAGVLGQPTTTTLFGNTAVDGTARSGFRLDVGRWIDREHTFGVDAGFLLLESQAAGFNGNSPTGNPILARPFFNAVTNSQTSQLVAFPGVATGSVAASYRNDNLIGVNIDFVERLTVCCAGFRLQPLLGYRYLQFNDKLAIDTNETAVGRPEFSAGTQITASDRFSAVNVFHGGDFGLRADYLMESLSVGLVTKLAVGDLNRSIGITGRTHVAVPGATPADFSGGLLALSSNSGVFNSNDWTIVPEFGVNLGWNIRRNLEMHLGYSFLFWSEVARASEQVDVRVNPNLIPPPMGAATPSLPSFTLRKSDIWVHSITLGLEYRF